MIHKPSFRLVGMIKGQAEFRPGASKPKQNLVRSTFAKHDGNRKFYVVETMGGEFPFTISQELKAKLDDGKIYELQGELEGVKGSMALRVIDVKESDELQYMTSLPTWVGLGVITGVQVNQETQATRCTLAMPGFPINFYQVPQGKVTMDTEGQLARVNGNLATRANTRSGATNIDATFINVEYVNAADVLKNKPEAKKAS